jgi:transcriptional regulator NrdR family protein
MSSRRKYDRTPKPPCPKCGDENSKVIDSDVYNLRVPPGTFSRRRECGVPTCRHKWYTLEQNISDSTICAFLLHVPHSRL